jgi:integrase
MNILINLTHIGRLDLLRTVGESHPNNAGLREGELRGLQWTDYQGTALSSVNRSIWKTFVNKPKTRASVNPVPVIRQMAEILNAYRRSVGDRPESCFTPAVETRWTSTS